VIHVIIPNKSKAAVARKEKVTLMVEIVIESGLANIGGDANVIGRGGAISLFNEEFHGDVKDVVFLETLFLHNVFLRWFCNGSAGVGLFEHEVGQPLFISTGTYGS
jgi:hypothetical protein